MTTTTRAVVRYIGGIGGERHTTLIHTPDQLVEGSVKDYYPACNGEPEHPGPDVIERYTLIFDGDEWLYLFEGTRERPLRERNRVLPIVGGPHDGTHTRIPVFATALEGEPSFPNAGHHTVRWFRAALFGEDLADLYELRHDEVVGQYWQYTG